MKISVRLEDEDVLKLKEYAQLRGVSLSRIVREIVSEKLDSSIGELYTYVDESQSYSEIC